MKNSDVELIQNVLDGDDSAFTSLVDKYQKQVHALAWRKTGDFHIAEEITQDTFLIVYQKLNTLKNRNQFSGWLYVIATRQCLAWLRRRRIETEPLEDMDIDMIDENAYSQYVAAEQAKVTLDEQRQVVKKLLSKLQESERTVMVLHYFGEMTCAEISRFLGTSPSAIKSRLSRARQRLKKDELMIREVLGNFQISANLTENIMKQIELLNPVVPSGSNPFMPWVMAATGIILAMLILGIGSKKLARLQHPYSLDAQSEIAIELIDTAIVQNIEVKPDVRNIQGNSSDTSDRGNGMGLESHQGLSDAVDYAEWQLPEGTKARLGKGDMTENIAFSPDGTRLAVASSIGIWIYDARPGKVKELDLLTGHTEMVKFVAFSPNGNRLASASDDKTVRIWEVVTGEHIATFDKHLGRVFTVAFSPDGNTIASGDIDGTVYLWNANTGQYKATLSGHTEIVHQIAFSPDGNMIATDTISTMCLWDVHTREQITTFKEQTKYFSSIAFSPDGNTIATSSDGNTVQLLDTRTAEHKTVLSGHKEDVTSIAYSPDGNIIATGSTDETVRLWDAHTGEHKTILLDLNTSVMSIAYSPDGNTMAISDSYAVRLLDTNTGKHIITLTEHNEWGDFVVFSPDGNTIATGSDDNAAVLWDVETRKQKMKLRGHASAVTCLAYSPDADVIATGGFDRTVRLWNAKTGKPITILTGHKKRINSIAFSPDGKIIASGSEETVRLWDAKTGKHKSTLLDNVDHVKYVGFSPDGSTFVCGRWVRCEVMLWNARTWKQMETLQVGTPVSSVAFSPDNKTLACVGPNRSLKLMDLNTRECVAKLDGHTAHVTSATFSPDGSILATGSEDSTVKLWELRSKKHIATLEGHKEDITSVTFSPDSSTIASISWDGTILLWQIR